MLVLLIYLLLIIIILVKFIISSFEKHQLCNSENVVLTKLVMFVVSWKKGPRNLGLTVNKSLLLSAKARRRVSSAL